MLVAVRVMVGQPSNAIVEDKMPYVLTYEKSLVKIFRVQSCMSMVVRIGEELLVISTLLNVSFVVINLPHCAATMLPIAGSSVSRLAVILRASLINIGSSVLVTVQDLAGRPLSILIWINLVSIQGFLIVRMNHIVDSTFCAAGIVLPHSPVQIILVMLNSLLSQNLWPMPSCKIFKSEAYTLHLLILVLYVKAVEVVMTPKSGLISILLRVVLHTDGTTSTLYPHSVVSAVYPIKYSLFPAGLKNCRTEAGAPQGSMSVHLKVVMSYCPPAAVAVIVYVQAPGGL